MQNWLNLEAIIAPAEVGPPAACDEKKQVPPLRRRVRSGSGRNDKCGGGYSSRQSGSRAPRLFWPWSRNRIFLVTLGQEPWTRLPPVLSPLL